MKLFEEEAQKVETVTMEDASLYNRVAEFCIKNGVPVNESLSEKMQDLFITESEVPTSDNSAIKDTDFKTTENSRGNDPTIDAAKDDSSQNGRDFDPAYIEDEIEDEGKKNDEFVNDADEDTIKNESADDYKRYSEILEYFLINNMSLNETQIEALQEEYLVEATDAKKSRKKFIDDIRKKVQKIFADEGIRMFLQETPNAKKFKNGESDTFNLRFDQESKGLRVAMGILSGGTSELNRAIYQQGSQTSLASQAGINQLIDDCEDDIADAIKEAGKDNGFDAELVRISINGLKIKATLNEDGWNALKDRKENKKAARVDSRETRKEVKKFEKEEEKAAKRAGRK